MRAATRVVRFVPTTDIAQFFERVIYAAAASRKSSTKAARAFQSVNSRSCPVLAAPPDLILTWQALGIRSLAFVMAGAVAVTFIGYKFVFRQPQPLLTAGFHLPEIKQIDRRLVLGAAFFGVGWGLSGFCPGPAITSLPLLAKGTLVFVPAMLGGMMVTRLITNTRLRAKTLVSGAGEAQMS